MRDSGQGADYLSCGDKQQMGPHYHAWMLMPNFGPWGLAPSFLHRTQGMESCQGDTHDSLHSHPQVEGDNKCINHRRLLHSGCHTLRGFPKSVSPLLLTLAVLNCPHVYFFPSVPSHSHYLLPLNKCPHPPTPTPPDAPHTHTSCRHALLH